MTIGGTDYYFAAQPVEKNHPFVLLRPKSSTKSQWTPFVESLLIAALAGAILAGIAALFLARSIAGPVRRVAEAARTLAPAGADPVPARAPRSWRARARVQRDGRAADASRRERAELPALGEPRAEDAADGDPGLGGRARRGRVRVQDAARHDPARGAPARAARPGPPRSRPDEPHEFSRPPERRRPRRVAATRSPAPGEAAASSASRYAAEGAPAGSRPTTTGCSRSRRTWSRTRCAIRRAAAR